MSFIRLLTLSYLAWAAVFVVTVTLIAHLPFPSAPATPARKTGKEAGQSMPVRPGPRAVARLDLVPETPLSIPRSAGGETHAEVMPPEPPIAREPAHTVAIPRPSKTIVIMPELPKSPVPRPASSIKQLASAKPVVRIPIAPPLAVIPPDLPKPNVPAPRPERTHLASAEPAFRIPDPPKYAMSDLPVPSPPSTHLASAGQVFRIPDPPPYALAPQDLSKPTGPVQRRAGGPLAGIKQAFRIPDPPPLDPPLTASRP